MQTLNRVNGEVIFEIDASTFNEAIQVYMKTSNDLRDADLSRANLTRADLSDCRGDGVRIKTIVTSTYVINYTRDVLQIGCEKHPFDAWENFTDEEIFEMDGEKAVKFWKKYKKFIFEAIELSPAEE